MPTVSLSIMGVKMSKPEITYADLDIALFKSSSAAEQVYYVYYDGDREVAKFDSAEKGKKWIEEIEAFGADFTYGFEGEVEDLTREVEYVDKGVEEGYKTFDNILKDYIEIANTPKFVGYVSKSSGSEVFRNKIATIKKYKGSRAGRKPIHLEAVRKYALSKPNIKQCNSKIELDGELWDIEVDDQCQALAQRAGSKGQLLSLDKDMMTSVGCWLLSPNYFDDAVYSDPKSVGLIEKSGDNLVGYGYLFLLGMMITGDTVDAITGVPRGGKAKALEVLTPFNNKPLDRLPEAFAEVAKLYKKAYGEEHTYKHWETKEEIKRSWKDMMIEQGKLLYMLRGKTDSFEKSVMKYFDEDLV